jgi:hypothetical protein
MADTTKSDLTVLDVVGEYLTANGYDGLYNPVAECACPTDDLSPGTCLVEDCMPGYKVPCDPETCPADGDCEFHIGPKVKGTK